MSSPPLAKDESQTGGLGALESTLRRTKSKGPAPVHLWNPPYCGEIGMRIAKDGTWFYQGSPIGRAPLVRLFASVLRKDEDGRHYLVTPVEKIGIDVDDVPFLAVEMDRSGAGAGQTLNFRTNVDDIVSVDASHPMRFEFDPGNGGLVPYILVRGGLEARVTRALYYDLVELALTETVEGVDHLGLWSAGTFFPMIAADELD
ncbi:MAG: DUF1285 domain-containing protein [Methyloligellaceae bacterium]